MGSIIETNDTLQVTKEQGFPDELDLKVHLKKPYKAEDFSGKTFQFKNKSKIRVYQQAPVRVFLVENRKGRWVYWGLVHILEIVHDYQKQTTAGKFRIIYLYSPEEMKQAFNLIDRNTKTQYFT